MENNTFQEEFLRNLFPEFKDTPGLFVTFQQITNNNGLGGLELTGTLFVNLSEQLKPGMLKNVHTYLSDLDPSRVVLFSGSRKKAAVQHYINWCNDMNLTPFTVKLYEMFASSYLAPELDHRRKDTEHIVNSEPEYHFMCMNRTARPHRIECLAQLWKQNNLDKGLISFPRLKGVDSFPLSDTAKSWFESEKTNLPYQIDGQTTVAGEINRVMRTFGSKVHFQIVTETTNEHSHPTGEMCFPEDLFVTEKTWKPFFMGNLLVVIGHPGTIAIARDKGFDAYDDIIDHTYDTIQNDQERFDVAMKEVDRLCKIPLVEWGKIRKNLLDRILSNHEKYINF